MSLKEWERDVLNRQRNIVFPDTNLNEGRFYRNIASGKAVFSRGQKASLLVIALYFLLIFSVALASAIGQFASKNRIQSAFTNLSGMHIPAGMVAFLDISGRSRSFSRSPAKRNDEEDIALRRM